MLQKKPLLMAIVNLTPDSFSDGGQYISFDSALQRCEQVLNEGADIIDIGGESTRPGAQKISEQEEMDRVLPLLEAVRREFDCALSVDTSKAALMREALKHKVSIINDVRALQKVEDLSFLAQSDCQICLMHMQGEPQTMQNAPQYNDVIDEVKTFLQHRIDTCCSAGIDKKRLIIDPGFGFGKSLQHNLQLLNQLQTFQSLDCPILVGISRKSMLGQVLDKTVDERLSGSLAALVLAINKGAGFVRVHDVAPSRDALDFAWATMNEDMG